MKIIDIEKVKKIQLDILSSLDKFCREKSINYFIIDGTLLGAVRHKGYIPWDDDIDVALTRSEYDRLMQEFPQVLDSHYHLISIERDGKWDRAYAAMYDDRTYVDYGSNKSISVGVLIDIFPVDEIPSDPQRWKKVRKTMNVYTKLISLKSNPAPAFIESPTKNIIVNLAKLLLLSISKRKLVEKKSQFAQSFRGCGSGLGYEVAFGIGAKEPFLLSDFISFSDYQFEDRVYQGPQNYDSVLSRTYGAYMTPPLEEERFAHHLLNAYYK